VEAAIVVAGPISIGNASSDLGGSSMSTPNGDRRPPLAVGIELASHIMSVAFMMALPAGAGYWGDLKLGTSPWLLAVGAVFGLFAGMTQLLRGMDRKRKKSSDKHDQDANPS
jgi:F0F1-type ATP synthase assembly protein I